MGSSVLTKASVTLVAMLIMGDVLYVWGQGVYGLSLLFFQSCYELKTT